MTFFDLRTGTRAAALPGGGLSCALGTFDGVHLGHRALLGLAADGVRPSAVFTFERNPFGTPALSLLDDKLEQLSKCGIDFAAVCDFDEIRNLPPERFVGELLVRELGCVRAVCGFNFRFGADAAGTPELLEREMKRRSGEFACAAPVLDGSEPISSSRIRCALREGDPASAARLLGRPFSFAGEVVHGFELGRTLGFPTINSLMPPELVMPKRGVYITSCLGLPAITNIGLRPTVSEDPVCGCETHIIGCDRELYGETVRVFFHERLRNERRFDSVAELGEQLSLDRIAALRYFEHTKTDAPSGAPE